MAVACARTSGPPTMSRVSYSCSYTWKTTTQIIDTEVQRTIILHTRQHLQWTSTQTAKSLKLCFLLELNLVLWLLCQKFFQFVLPCEPRNGGVIELRKCWVIMCILIEYNRNSLSIKCKVFSPANFYKHISYHIMHTSLMAAQNLLCRTLCRACSLGWGSSPVRCSLSSSSITLHISNPANTHKPRLPTVHISKLPLNAPRHQRSSTLYKCSHLELTLSATNLSVPGHLQTSFLWRR